MLDFCGFGDFNNTASHLGMFTPTSIAEIIPRVRYNLECMWFHSAVTDRDQRWVINELKQWWDWHTFQRNPWCDCPGGGKLRTKCCWSKNQWESQKVNGSQLCWNQNLTVVCGGQQQNRSAGVLKNQTSAPPPHLKRPKNSKDSNSRALAQVLQGSCCRRMGSKTDLSKECRKDCDVGVLEDAAFIRKWKGTCIHLKIPYILSNLFSAKTTCLILLTFCLE